MEEKETIVVENKDNKGNPNHKPAGSPDGGQFTSGGGSSLKDKLLNFTKSKATVIDNGNYLDVVLKHNLSDLKSEHIKSCFEAGTPEAKKIVGDFFDATHTKISKCKSGQVAHYSPLFHSINFEPSDLKNTGKHSGYYELGETFYHETFHAIDDRYGELTTKYKLANGKTIQTVFHDEIADNKYSWSWHLYDEIKEDFEKARQEEIDKLFTPEQIADYNEKADYYKKEMDNLWKNFDNHASHYPSYQIYLNAYNEVNNKWKQLKKEWTKVSDAFLPARQKAVHKYSCLSDFCSYIYKTGTGSKSICGGHPKSYWKGDRPIKEMWAELGSMWARGKTEDLNRMRKYFPKTVGAFEEIISNLDTIRKDKFGL